MSRRLQIRERPQAGWDEEFERKWLTWLEAQVQDEFQGGNVYFAIQGAMCNYGLQLHMNASQFTYAKRRDYSVQVDVFPQPILVMPAVKIMLHNALKAVDPYERLVDGDIAIDRDTLVDSQHIAGEMLSLKVQGIDFLHLPSYIFRFSPVQIDVFLRSRCLSFRPNLLNVPNLVPKSSISPRQILFSEEPFSPLHRSPSS